MFNFDREAEQLEQDLIDGLITQAEYNSQVRSMRAEMRAIAEEAGERERDRMMDSFWSAETAKTPQ